MKKILLIFGTRPEAIKMAPLYFTLNNLPEHFVVKTCLTTQHKDLLDQVVSLFKLKADYDLNVMIQNQDLFYLTSAILSRINEVIIDYKPDIILVQGDTTSTFIGSLAGFYHHISVGHVEAGLRTYNIYSPWPEEVNRQLTTRIARYHFAPTQHNRENLLKEQIDPAQIIVTGNTGIDALFYVKSAIEKQIELKQQVIKSLTDQNIELSKKKFIYITAHRREHFGNEIKDLFSSIKQLATTYVDFEFIFPVHPNPNVLIPAQEILGTVKNIHLIKPVDYITSVYLISHAYFILSDSGGIQEEAPSLGKPLLVMRNETERPEAIWSGICKLVGTNPEKIFKEASELIDNASYYQSMAKQSYIFGDGTASEKIANFLRNQKLCS